MQIRRVQIFTLILLLIFSNSFGKSHFKILQTDNQQPIPFANVTWQMCENVAKKGFSTSNKDGVVAIEAEYNTRIIFSISCVGYKSFLDTVEFSKGMHILLDKDILNLDQVVVTGTRTPHVLKKAPVLTQLISETEIRSVDSEIITDILTVEMPGIEMSNHGGTPVMNMMGMETQYSLVLIDGERMAKSLQKTIDYSRINTANIERIEIVRGASSALYGSDAMGGVINIITKKPRKKWDVSADFRFQERNEKNHTQLDIDNADDDYARDFYKNIDRQNINGNLSVGYRNKGFYSNTFVNYKSHDGYKLFDTKGQKRYYKDSDVVITEDISESPTTVFGFQDFTINQKFGYEKNKWKFGVNGSIYNHDEFDFTNDALHQYYRSYNGGGNVSYNIDDKSELAISHSSDKYQRFTYSEKDDSKTKTHDNAFHTGKIIYTTTWGKHGVLAEFENLYQTLETDKFVYGELLSKSTNDAVIVLQDEFQWNARLTLVGGVRAGYHSAFDFHISPSITAKYSFNKFNLRASYARGFRSPDLKELYMNWSHLGMFQIIGSEELKPETNNYYSLSVDFVEPAHNLNATVIASYNDIKDKIDGLWTNNETEYRYMNFNSAEVFSIEAMLKWKFHKNFKLKTGYIFLDSKKSTDAQDLSTMSPMALTAQFEYRFVSKNYQLNANLSGKVTGEKELDVLDDDEDSPYYNQYYKVKYPSYSTWNFTVNQYFGKHIRFGLGVKNIFDYTAPIATFNTSNTPGRKFFTSISYTL